MNECRSSVYGNHGSNIGSFKEFVGECKYMALTLLGDCFLFFFFSFFFFLCIINERKPRKHLRYSQKCLQKKKKKINIKLCSSSSKISSTAIQLTFATLQINKSDINDYI